MKRSKLRRIYMIGSKSEVIKRIHYISIVLFFISCGRTPSRDRFELATNIEIPDQVVVLKDEYHDMIQDYVIEYAIQLNQVQSRTVANSIVSSKFYNPDAIGNEIVLEEYFIDSTQNSVWYRTNSGYRFASRNDRRIFGARFDTTTLILEFYEGYD